MKKYTLDIIRGNFSRINYSIYEQGGKNEDNKVIVSDFAVLTICGAIYVIYTGGKANAGYAVIPMILFLISSQWPHAMKKHKK